MSDELSKIDPWFTAPCREILNFLVEEHGFTLSGRKIAYEAFVYFASDAARIKVSCERGFLPRVFVNEYELSTLDKSFDERWTELHRHGQYDVSSPEYGEAMVEMLEGFAELLRSNPGVLIGDFSVFRKPQA